MSATIITKATTVMYRDGVYPNFVSFMEEQEDGLPVIPRYLEISTEKWDDLGAPNVITLTIEPGDRLNDDHRTDGYL